jgi:hypothetical protein
MASKLFRLALTLTALVVPQLGQARETRATLDATMEELGHRFLDEKQAVGLSIGIWPDPPTRTNR